MVIKKTLIFAFLLLTFSSCALTGFVTETPKSEIRDVQRFAPVCDIDLLDKYDNGGHNDSLSELCRLTIENYMDQQNAINTTGYISIEDSIIQNRVNEEIRQFNSANVAIKEKAQHAYLPTIDSILKQNGKRFGLLIHLEGFERTKQNWGEMFFKGFAYSIGAYGASDYYEAYSKLTIIIYDSNKKNIPFYDFSIKPDSKPTHILDQQLYRLINQKFK